MNGSYAVTSRPVHSVLATLGLGLALLLAGCPPERPGNDAECVGAGCGDAQLQSCSADDDCKPGTICRGGYCRAPSGCEVDEDCPEGEQCIRGGCYEPAPDTGPTDAGDADDGPGDADGVSDGGETDVDGGVDACSGCIVDTDAGLQCVSGEDDQACGSGGERCSVCGDDEVCKEGTCKQKPCNSQNCSKGCCLQGTCKMGTADDACGVGGETCDRCTGQTECRNQTCTIVCNSSTCGGCCDDGKCKKGTSDSACGSGGESCSTCGSDEKCADGKCVQLACSKRCTNGCCRFGSCKSGTTDSACGDDGESCDRCGRGFDCEFQRCDLDNNSKWNLVGVSADIPKTDENGVYWDSKNNEPDVFLKVKNEGFTTTHKGKTKVDKDDQSPFWYDDTVTNVEASDLRRYNKTTFTLIDDDPWYSPNDQIAQCTIDIDEKHFDGQIYEVTCKGAKSGSNQVEATVKYKIDDP